MAPEDPLRALGPEGHLKAPGLVDQIFDRIDLALLGLPEGTPWPEGLGKHLREPLRPMGQGDPAGPCKLVVQLNFQRG